MRDERIQVEFPFCKQLQKAFHVPRFRPADVTDGIIASFLLVGCIVAAGSVGTRNAEVEFLFVIALALQFHPHGANRDNNGAVARNFCSLVHRLATGRLGRDENGVHSETMRPLRAHVGELG
jgi:hypothetical protein